MSGVDFDPAAVPIRPAATVLLVRDDDVDRRLEVFMLQRNRNTAFAGGMFVFPGGRVDDLDDIEDYEELCDGLTDAEASAILGINRGGLAFWVAAIRECFEEAGVLLARPRGSTEALRFDDPVVALRYTKARHQIHEGELSLAEFCRREDLLLITDAIHYFAHWVTPYGEVRRFDTRFFLARAPQAQEPLHDNHETVDSIWVNPGDALERYSQRKFKMIFPTIKNLELIASGDSADDAIKIARRSGRPPRIWPRVLTDENGKVTVIKMPGEPGFEDLPTDEPQN
jgi:8-oxo-dGTP pyrophosphatase MutT (NUDIX family)